MVSCGQSQGKGGEFILNNGAEPESLDPHLISGVPEHRIYMALFEGLVAYDPKTATAVPGLAESWEFSDDNTVITFKLRQTTWSDGVPITAETVKKSWERMLSPELAAPYAWFPAMFLKGAAEYNAGDAGPDALGVEVVDKYTLKVELVGPLPYALDAFAHYSFAVVPLHAIEKYGKEWTSPDNFVGNGPFVLETWEPQNKITVVPNPKYWDKDAVKLSRVVYLPIEDNNTSYNMYLNGEIDWQTTVPTDRIKEAKLRDDYIKNPQLATYYYIFNNTKKPFDDPRVRKALSMAVNRQELVERVTQAGQITAYGIVPPMTGYKGVKGLGEDVEKAKALLAEAGYPNGEGFPEVEILYNTSEGHQKIAEFIQQQWKVNLGINVKLTNQEWKTYLTTRREGQFYIARAGWVGDYQDPNTFLDMFVTGGDMNDAFYSNPQYDELIHKAARMAPGPDRFATLMQAEELLITQDHAIMPLYFYVTINMIDTNKWGGWYPNVMDIHPLKNIYKK
ncbi:peptide ABC transporter substrate-binding protein [Rarispira pelagica]|uniref:peptide ABC transporter substrate-binding protein n=1 Tax=Rarispira pelagica TaxID=3141764 RepID=UPI003B27FE01